MKDKRNDSGVFTSIVGIITNFILASLKMLCGIITLSISIIADSINNFSDMASSIINLIGFKIADKPADDNHPFGHKRMEYVSGLILAVIIMAVDIELVITSVKNLFDPSTLEIRLLPFIILSISIGVKIILMIFYYVMYRKTKSISIKALAEDSRNDSITTSIVLIGLLVYYQTGFKYTDSIASILVGIVIFISAINILKDAVSPLLGEEMDNEIYKNIIYDLKNIPEIYGLHDPLCHIYGHGNIFMSIHAEIDSKYSLEEAHMIVDKSEDLIKEKYNVNLVIHADPISLDSKTIELKDKCASILLSINPEFFLHDFHINNNSISFECIKPRDIIIDDNEIVNIFKNQLPGYEFNIEFEYSLISNKELKELR